MTKSNFETWRPIAEFENLYKVSNTGKIFSLITNRLKKFSKQKTGYLQVSLSKNGKIYYKYVHRLVAQAFIEKKEFKNVVNHKDCNKENNSVLNLEWVTDAENNHHAGVNNLKPIGTKHANSKFTKQDLLEIEKLLKEKELTHKQIAKLFNVHRATISKFARNQTYIKEAFNAE